jgi:hypothetical protein
MAGGNDGLNADPADGDFDDWLELLQSERRERDA